VSTPKRRYEHQLHDGKYIYGTTRWRRLRDAYIRHNPLCELCSKVGLVTPGEVVDHVIELKDGGAPWDVGNLMTVCRECHQKKTGEEVKKRRRRKSNNGFGSLSDF